MGAMVRPSGVAFRVWAPAAASVDVELIRPASTTYHPLERDSEGVYFGLVRGAHAGDRYRFRLDGGDSYPDPCSRYQPEGVHGPSQIVDPAFGWSDAGWAGLDRDRLVIYECHVGTYTSEGTFDALVPQLRELRRLGITALELMPVAEFPGKHNWGYDGVDLFAPSRNYGGHAGLKRLVDAAHRHEIGVILDVVYNHLGPDGNYLRLFSPDYFTDRHTTPWGAALNFDGPGSQWVREFVIQNACYWLTEYHVDGLRLDATHAILDESSTHLIAELTVRARQAVGEERRAVILAENAANDVRLIRPVERGGYGLDGVLADSFHHSLRVFLTGEREGYFADYSGTAEEITRVIEEGFVYQGRLSPRLGRSRGTRVTDEPASSFVFCIQNHDQVGNRPLGDRLNQMVGMDQFAVASALLLMVPETPMLFMGQEFAASSPFLYFTDHHKDLGSLVTIGRRAEFSYMEGFSDPAQRERVPDPQDARTFLASKIRLEERWEHYAIYRMYRELLRLRRTDPVLSIPDRARTKASAPGESTVTLVRWGEAGRRLVVANFGPAAEFTLRELLPSEWSQDGWRQLFSTCGRRYDGTGQRPSFSGVGPSRRLRMPAASAAVFGAA